MTTAEALCTIDGCSKRKSKRGMCAMHHWRWRHKGDPLAPGRPAPLTFEGAVERYLSRCVWDGDCLVLPNATGYGEVRWDDRRTTAHRAVYVTQHGPLDESLVVRHKCDNPPCVNIAHLLSGTPSQNARDAYERNRRVTPWPKGEETHTAILTDDDVARLRRSALNGAGLRELARDNGLNYTTVRAAVRGITWSHLADPPPVPNVRRGRPQVERRISTIRPDDCLRAVDMAGAGMSLAEIAIALGVSRHTASKLVGAAREVA